VSCRGALPPPDFKVQLSAHVEGWLRRKRRSQMFRNLAKWYEEMGEKEQRVTIILLAMTVLALILAAAVLVMVLRDVL
jgi:hypothetical protein